MTASAQFINASEAAQRLGVSAKALRLYEEQGLLSPRRTGNGWRTYGPDEMRRAGDIVAVRRLGFSLAQVQRVLDGNPEGLEPALAAHQSRLEGQAGALAQTVERVRVLRGDLAQGKRLSAADLAQLATPSAAPIVAFDLPWPWGGERFELRDVRAINYLIGSLGSGKTRLAKRLAELLPGCAFVDLERLPAGGETAEQRLDADMGLRRRVEATVAWLIEEGATASDALLALIVVLEAEGDGVLVIDMIEQGLDEASQRALASQLRRRGPQARPVFVITRSCAILDLAAVGPHEAIILCPANHGLPTTVAPYPGSPGYEAVATCLASPDVRARTEGMVVARREG